MSRVISNDSCSFRETLKAKLRMQAPLTVGSRSLTCTEFVGVLVSTLSFWPAFMEIVAGIPARGFMDVLYAGFLYSPATTGWDINVAWPNAEHLERRILEVNGTLPSVSLLETSSVNVEAVFFLIGFMALLPKGMVFTVQDPIYRSRWALQMFMVFFAARMALHLCCVLNNMKQGGLPHDVFKRLQTLTTCHAVSQLVLLVVALWAYATLSEPDRRAPLRYKKKDSEASEPKLPQDGSAPLSDQEPRSEALEMRSVHETSGSSRNTRFRDSDVAPSPREEAETFHTPLLQPRVPTE